MSAGKALPGSDKAAAAVFADQREHACFIDNVSSARDALARKLKRAKDVELEASALRLSGRDSSTLDLELADLLVAIRIDLNAITDEIERTCGEHFTPGMRLAHFGKELRNARQALRVAEIQHERIGFVLDQLKSQPASQL
jgi:hypothetical protein